MLADVVAFLTCPGCGSDVGIADGAVRCERGHAFDIARQGYVNLLAGEQPPGTADTVGMVEARDAFLGGGHYRVLEEALEAQARGLGAAGDLVVDAGAGTAHYLRRMLDAVDGAGLALDVSKPALQRAARAHPRIGAVLWDVWRPWPLRSGTASLVLNVFSPRNGREFRRVLRPDGALLVVTPSAEHLAELESAFDLLTVDPRKDERLEEALGLEFRAVDRTVVRDALRLSHAEVETLIAMGPTAHHVGAAEITREVRRLAEPVAVTASFLLSVYLPV